VDTVYVNGRLPALADGGYAAASTLARPLVYLPAAVNQMLFPFLTLATSRTRRTVLGRMLAAAAAVALPALACTALFPRLLLETTFGTAYGTASGILPAVAIVLAPYSLVNIVFYDTMARHDRALTWTVVAVAAAAGVLLFATPPSLAMLFTTLAVAAGVIVAAGLGRIWRTLVRPDTGAP
jgi:O-antigen/teichoic acid export membrane protein